MDALQVNRMPPITDSDVTDSEAEDESLRNSLKVSFMFRRVCSVLLLMKIISFMVHSLFWTRSFSVKSLPLLTD